MPVTITHTHAKTSETTGFEIKQGWLFIDVARWNDVLGGMISVPLAVEDARALERMFRDYADGIVT